MIKSDCSVFKKVHQVHCSNPAFWNIDALSTLHFFIQFSIHLIDTGFPLRTCSGWVLPLTGCMLGYAPAAAVLNTISGLEAGWMHFFFVDVASRLADYCHNCRAHNNTVAPFVGQRQRPPLSPTWFNTICQPASVRHRVLGSLSLFTSPVKWMRSLITEEKTFRWRQPLAIQNRTACKI